MNSTCRKHAFTVMNSEVSILMKHEESFDFLARNHEISNVQEMFKKMSDFKKGN